LSRKILLIMTLLVVISTSSCEPDTIPEPSQEETASEASTYPAVWTTPSATTTPTTSPTPIPQLPLLQTRANQFVDEEEIPVVLHGIAIVDPILLESGQNQSLGRWEEEIFQTLHAWGADVVRLPVHPPNYRQAGVDHSLQVLDQAVEWAAENDLYVIIDFHGLGFPPDGTYASEWAATDVDEIIDFWQTISEHFTGNNVVAFYEIFNEPGRETSGLANLDDWRTWKAFCEQVIEVIRENDPDTIILIGALNFGNNLYPVWQDPIDAPNIGYTCHPYPGQSRWIDWETAFGRVAEDYPVFLTEFGFEVSQFSAEFIRETSFAGPGRYRDALMAYTEELGIGWVAWVFSDQWTPRMLKDTSYTPSEFGEFVREQLLRYAGDDSP
jgi:endoglucanase